MMIFWQYLFWISLSVVCIPYVLYPALILLLSKFKKNPDIGLLDEANLPFVDILFAAYNEEAVLEEKLQSLLNLDYPKNKLKIHVGSDNSRDETNNILKKWSSEHPAIEAYIFSARTGKSNILNTLKQRISGDLMLLTDANIIFEPLTLKLMIRRMHSMENVGAVGANIHYGEFEGNGISGQEDTYLKLENRIKESEALLANAPLGLEGGCYLIRRDLFPEIPALFFMEDFFVTLHVLEHKFKVLWEPLARVWEDVSVSPQEEYKRKVRISIGNFQNLKFYRGFLWRQLWPKGLMFIGHKILRWLSPFFLLSLLISAPQLILVHWFYGIVAGCYMLFIGLGMFGILFSQKQNLGWLKYPGHFIYMNLALLEGFLQYIKGIKTNAWQPTARKQA
jgi:cellulose synthase/poly-beta-1,6-N-acetylglucosamine synthase-like glycosyltransferase